MHTYTNARKMTKNKAAITMKTAPGKVSTVAEYMDKCKGGPPKAPILFRKLILACREPAKVKESQTNICLS